jgi:hypothetical protein
MARSYANIFTAIWRDKEFRSLLDADQKMYFLLISQPDITAVGALPLTVGRWAACAADTTPESVRRSLDNLAGARFIGMDFETEELLVRTFVRHDGGYGNRKRVPVIRRAAGEVVSARLTRMLFEEFVSLDLSTDGLWDALSDGLSGSPSLTLVPPTLPVVAQRVVLTGELSTPDGAFQQVDRLSDSLWHSPSDGVSPSEGVVECLVSGTSPHPSTLIPAVSGDAASGGTKKQSKRATRLPASWRPNDVHTARAGELGLDLDRQVELFRLNADTNDRTAKNWNAAFTTWLIKAPQFDRTAGRPTAPKTPDRETARSWLLAEYEAGRVRPIEQRTGLRYEVPDLPDHVSGKAAAEKFAVDHARDWIKANHETIIERLMARSAS